MGAAFAAILPCGSGFSRDRELSGGRLLDGLAAATRVAVDFLDDARGEIQAAAAAGRFAEVRIDRTRAAQAGSGCAANIVVAVAVAEAYVHGR